MFVRLFKQILVGLGALLPDKALHGMHIMIQYMRLGRWMKSHGEQDKALIVSEYGIPMPAEYGFGAQRVTDFMLGTFDTMLTAADPELGYPADDYRLVQRWAWFSLADDTYATGNLIDRADGGLTPLGRAYAGYAAASP